jgi:hypothetical protein
VNLANLDLMNCSTLREVHIGGISDLLNMDKMLNDLAYLAVTNVIGATNSNAGQVWFDNPGTGCWCTGPDHGVTTNSAAARDALFWRGWTTNMWCN